LFALFSPFAFDSLVGFAASAPRRRSSLCFRFSSAFLLCARSFSRFWTVDTLFPYAAGLLICETAPRLRRSTQRSSSVSLNRTLFFVFSALIRMYGIRFDLTIRLSVAALMFSNSQTAADVSNGFICCQAGVDD
jgi:hypothetical protein